MHPYAHAKSVIALLVVLMPSLAFAAEGPSRDQLRSALAMILPPYTSIEEFTVEASQNIGSIVEPVITSRIRARIRTTEDLFDKSHELDDFLLGQGRPVVKTVASKGTSQDVYFISQSSLFQGQWNSTFRAQGRPFYASGEPLATFGGNVLIEGSREEREFAQEVRRRQEEVERRQAEHQRLLQTSRQARHTIHSYRHRRLMTEAIIKDTEIRIGGSPAIWYGDISWFQAWRGQGTGYLRIMTTRTFLGLQFEENELEIVMEKLLTAYNDWRTKYCPKTGAPTCTQGSAYAVPAPRGVEPQITSISLGPGQKSEWL